MRCLPIVIALLLLALASALPAAVVHNEATNGDLSNNGNAPTALGAFAAGTHSVISTSVNSDIDNFTFTIPPGLTLAQIVPTAYAGDDETAFIGLQAGTTIDNTGATLMGWQHFGPTMGNMNTNLLPFMAPGPLGPGSYTIWIQQTNATAPSTTTMDVVVTPEPGGVLSIALLAFAFTTARAPRRPPCR
jgi:hypothetical protein